MRAGGKLGRKRWIIRLFHWEYWSFGAIYTWIYPFWFWQCLRSRSFFFFAASNPSIKNGGFLSESKKEIAGLIPDVLHPKTVFFALPSNADHVIELLRKKGLSFPLIGKPDIGGRGRGVKVLPDEQSVREYVKNAFLDFHIQEFVPWKKEVGIFYYRYPGSPTGKLSGIVRKEFLSVTGDGNRSVRELLLEQKRAIMYLPAIERMLGDALRNVPASGETRVISPYGNHARGSMFADDSYLIDEELTKTVDRICQSMPDFYFGRLDIRYNSWEELKAGRNFSIIEVNGAGSEPTHIYDPGHSLFFAWKEIIRHWSILGRISRMNHRAGYRYLNIREGWNMFRENRECSRRLAAMPE